MWSTRCGKLVGRKYGGVSGRTADLTQVRSTPLPVDACLTARTAGVGEVYDGMVSHKGSKVVRAGAAFNATAAVEVSAAAVGGGHSGWRSPVPYLFGGLAAMMGLIAFALLLLACSYWKLSGYLDGGDEPGAKTGEEVAMPVACYEEKFVVIMAGDEKPTYLATPVSSRPSSFGDHTGKEDDNNDKDMLEDCMGTGNETQNKDHIRGQSENHNLDV
ncbi:hypothetical protein BHM03_00058573 [Ensete ventricosum]|nr:hypothetical protein BHM03_00058573 [Ensete ventricosum]